MMRTTYACLALALPLVADCAETPGQGAAQVRVEDRTYPIVVNEKSGWSPVATLRGKETYTTPAVILENEYLRAVVLPEFGGRLVEVAFKPKDLDLFWRNDKLLDRGPGRMGGGQWSFPFWEHGRHFDETCGYTIVRHAGGGATLAMDMRFDDFLKPRETTRYGRATNLRLVQSVRMEPGRAALDWSARVENPLPIRCGFKLWWLLRQNAAAGVQVLMPTAAVTGHGAGRLVPWDPNTVIRAGLQDSLFSIGIRHDFAGWYLPAGDLNVLRLQDHRTAPGAKQVLYQPNPGGYIEMWGGNHEVFEECGRILPAFGAYENRMTLLAAAGIGKADYANRHSAVSCARKEDGTGWDVKLAPLRDLDGATLTLEERLREEAAAEPVTMQTGRIGPARPFHTFLPRRAKAVGMASSAAERVRLVWRDTSGEALVDRAFPVDVGPLPEAEFAAAQARVRKTMPGGAGLYAEATDLTAEHGLNLPKSKGLNRQILAGTSDVQALLDAARQLMRVEVNSSNALAGLDKVLAAQPADPHANLYKAVWLWEAGRTDEAQAHLAKAAALPGTRYLLALLDVSKKKFARAEEHLTALLAMPAETTFHGAGDPGLALLQSGSFVSATRPRLLLAIVFQTQGKKEAADALLRKLVENDPALIEAWMLLGDAERLKTLTGRNESGKAAAERIIAALTAGRWDGIGRP